MLARPEKNSGSPATAETKATIRYLEQQLELAAEVAAEHERNLKDHIWREAYLEEALRFIAAMANSPSTTARQILERDGRIRKRARATLFPVLFSKEEITALHTPELRFSASSAKYERLLGQGDAEAWRHEYDLRLQYSDAADRQWAAETKRRDAAEG